jgi:oxygen-dependent protoporphyrinogen oxidase
MALVEYSSSPSDSASEARLNRVLVVHALAVGHDDVELLAHRGGLPEVADVARVEEVEGSRGDDSGHRGTDTPKAGSSVSSIFSARSRSAGVSTSNRLRATFPAADSAAALRGVNYNPQAVVHLHSEADLTGAGYQIQYDEDFRTLGVTWNASLLDREGVSTCYLGGSRNPELVERSDERLEQVAVAEFEEITGASAQPLSVHRLRRGMPAYDRTWSALDRVSTPEGIRLCTNYTARAGIPGRIREAERVAGELAERDADSVEKVVV